MAGFNGFADYYGGDAVKAFADVDDPALQEQLKTASAAASEAMRGLGTWLASQRGSATQDFALGADRFQRMVRATEGVDASLDQLEAGGRADLKRNQDALTAACALYAKGKTIPQCIDKMNADKAPDGPVAEARRQIPSCAPSSSSTTSSLFPAPKRRRSRKARPTIGRTPPISTPPGRSKRTCRRSITSRRPIRRGTRKRRTRFVPGRKDLLFTSIHEVMPGHFLQFLHSNRPNRRSVACSSATPLPRGGRIMPKR